MEIQLTVEQEAFVRQAVASGRLARGEDAVEQALGMWIEHERSRLEILAALDVAEADIGCGRFTEYTEESLRELGEDIKRRGRERLRDAVGS